MQNRPQGWIFLRLPKLKIPKVFKFQMEASVLSLPLSGLGFGISPKNIREVDENSHFSFEKTVCTTGYFSEQYSADGFLKGGAGTCKGHSETSSESSFINKS